MKHRKLFIVLIIFIIVSFGVFAFREQIAKSASYGWLQASWSGGADTGAVANHTDNKTGWTKFFSKDANVVTDNDELALLNVGSSSVEYTNTSDFDGGNVNNGSTCLVHSNDKLQLIRKVSYGGTDYPVIQIGTQCWMAKNLNIGTLIAGGSNQTNNSVIQKYCYNNNEAYCTTYGGLYQWNEAMQYVTTVGAQGICPTGWHIPTDAEQYTLENYLKDSEQTCIATRTNFGCSSSGTKLKSGGSSGFNSLLIGVRDINGTFTGLNSNTYLWSSSMSGSDSWYRGLVSTSAMVSRMAGGPTYGLSIRCIKD